MKDFVMPLSLSNICLCTCQIFAISSLKHLFAQILCPRAQICVLTRVVAILNFFWRNELMLHSRREKEMAKTLFARKARQDIRFTLCKIISTSLSKMPVHFFPVNLHSIQQRCYPTEILWKLTSWFCNGIIVEDWNFLIVNIYCNLKNVVDVTDSVKKGVP